MLRLDLAQAPRLLQIETNTRERLDEAAACTGSARSPPWKKDCATSRRRNSRQNVSGSEIKPSGRI
jgi:hypothetical protein